MLYFQETRANDFKIKIKYFQSYGNSFVTSSDAAPGSCARNLHLEMRSVAVKQCHWEIFLPKERQLQKKEPLLNF